MRRESIPLPDKQDCPVKTSTESSPSPASEAVVAIEDAGQRVALWSEQTLAAQALAFRRLTDSLQAAVDDLMAAQSPQRLLEVRDTLLAVVREEAARWQNQTIDAWCTLQRDLARHAALSAAVAAEETMDLLWPPSAPRTMRAQPAWSDESSPLGDETFKAWERLWLPWVQGADTPSRA